MGRGCWGGTETHLVCCGSFFIRREKKISLWVHMSKESSIKVICWSLKYARTCFSAGLRDYHALPEGRADEGSCRGKWWSRGAVFHLHFHTTPGQECQQPTWRQFPDLPGNQSLLPGLSVDPKGSSLLKERTETRRGSNVDGVTLSKSLTWMCGPFLPNNGRIIKSIRKVCCENSKQ